MCKVIFLPSSMKFFFSWCHFFSQEDCKTFQDTFIVSSILIGCYSAASVLYSCKWPMLMKKLRQAGRSVVILPQYAFPAVWGWKTFWSKRSMVWGLLTLFKHFIFLPMDLSDFYLDFTMSLLSTTFCSNEFLREERDHPACHKQVDLQSWIPNKRHYLSLVYG